jgi:hypothetical protein
MNSTAAALAFACALIAGPLAGQSSPPPEGARAADAALHDMSHHDHMAADNPHLRLSAKREATPADSARAAELVARIRRDLARYRDVEAARAAGYVQFLPNVALPVYHFTNRRYGLEAAFAFDATRPTSLLYRKNPDGGFTLTGVMYTAPARLPEERLDARIPLGTARWHQHINWCLPRKGEESRWRETRGGKPLFGPESTIAGKEACDAVRGRFVPRLFGWMVHVNAFESDDPAVIWGDHH